MKLFVYDWNFITKKALYQTFREQGIEFDLFSPPFSPRIEAQRKGFGEELEKALEGKEYDALFSINFQGELARAAKERDILYICWTYDSPAISSTEQAVFLDTNRIFVFDSHEYRNCRADGVPNLHYLPLAVDVKEMNRLKPTPQQLFRYRADISLVGKLYKSETDRLFSLLDEYSGGYISAIVNTQMNIYNANVIKELINEKLISRMINEDVVKMLADNLNDNFLHDVKEVNTHLMYLFLNKAVTNKERLLLLSLLSRYHSVKLYSMDKSGIEGVREMGLVEYNTQTPLVFKGSRINLNVTLRTIRHGIPQRVLDIMACRALALTNYQEDLLEYFRDGESVLIYSSAEEALDKCNYYLAHDAEAEKIRQNGYKIVKDKFSYKQQLDKIWELSGVKDRL